jgi:hypothetical protein
MSQAIPSPINCGSECEDTTIEIPGPPGADGTNGTDGSDGINAFTVTSASFTMPAEGANVTVSVEESGFASIGQVLFFQYAGYLQVVTIPSSTSIQIQNLKSTGSSLYLGNAAPGTIIPSGSTVSPAGIQGPEGAPTADAFLIANNLSEGTAATMRTNLGLGTAATKTSGVANTNLPPVDTTFTNGDALFATATGVQSKTAAAAKTALGLVIGTDVQAYDAELAAIAGLVSAADRLPYFTGSGTASMVVFASFSRAILAAATAATWREALGGLLPRYGLLGIIENVDLNSAGSDNAIAIEAQQYRIDRITVDAATDPVTTATVGVFTAVGGGGTTLFANQTIANLTAPEKFDDITPQAIVGTDTRTEASLFFRCGTAEGSPCSVRVSVFGWTFPV